MSAERLHIHDLLRIHDEQKGDWCAIAREVEARTIERLRATPPQQTEVRPPDAWLNPENTRDCITAAKKDDMETVNGMPGKALAAKYKVPLYAGSAPQQWLPIESAPKDGTSILGYWLGGQHDCAIHATKFHNGRWWEPNEDYPQSAPTHWQPLPAPPSPKEQEHGN